MDAGTCPSPDAEYAARLYRADRWCQFRQLPYTDRLALTSGTRVTREPDTPISGGGFLSKAATPLPGDLARQGVSRLRTAAWAFAGMWALVIVMNDFVFAGKAGAPGIVWGPRQTSFTIVGLASSLAMVWLSRRLENRAGALFDIALVYQVLTALLVSLLTELVPRTEPQAISWVCVVILTMPVIAPSTPLKTLLASTLAAATVPVAVVYALWVEPAYDPPLSVLVWLTLPPFLCAALSVIPATVIRGLSRQVTRAREVGSYELQERIGEGGMGEVYRATHRLLARPAAVKLISPAVLASSAPGQLQVAIERFRREAQAAASLKSAHTIQLYDYGVSDQGIFYYVMELLDGIDLRELVRRHGPLPAERVVHILAQACESLGEAHAVGLVHRDIKPSNILVCRMGLRVDFVKVLDFGLVKKAGDVLKDVEDVEDLTHLTTAGTVHGTPAFMSPECVTGIRNVGTSSDVYALGCVAYWLLTGQHVFTAPNATAMMIMHIQAAPVPPSAKSPHPVPPALEQIVMRCLAKNPAHRPGDATALLAQLTAMPLPLPWTETRAEEWWRANLSPAALH